MPYTDEFKDTALLILPILLSFLIGTSSLPGYNPQVWTSPIVMRNISVTTDDIKDRLIPFYANYYGISRYTLDSVVSCESGYVTTAVNDRHDAPKNPEYSVGLAQINLLNHAISKETAMNPFYALNYLAKGLRYHTDTWTCATKLAYNDT